MKKFDFFLFQGSRWTLQAEHMDGNIVSVHLLFLLSSDLFKLDCD